MHMASHGSFENARGKSTALDLSSPERPAARGRDAWIPADKKKPATVTHPCDVCVERRTDCRALQRKLAEQTRDIAMLENRLVLIDETWAQNTLSMLQEVKEVHAKSVELDMLYGKYTLSASSSAVYGEQWRQEHEEIKNCSRDPCENCEEATSDMGIGERSSSQHNSNTVIVLVPLLKKKKTLDVLVRAREEKFERASFLNECFSHHVPRHTHHKYVNVMQLRT